MGQMLARLTVKGDGTTHGILIEDGICVESSMEHFVGATHERIQQSLKDDCRKPDGRYEVEVFPNMEPFRSSANLPGHKLAKKK